MRSFQRLGMRRLRGFQAVISTASRTPSPARSPSSREVHPGHVVAAFPIGKTEMRGESHAGYHRGNCMVSLLRMRWAGLRRTPGSYGERKSFFSEETKQRTFKFAPAEACRPWPGSWERRRSKSLLVLFFRKEHALRLLYRHCDHADRMRRPGVRRNQLRGEFCVLRYAGARGFGWRRQGDEFGKSELDLA